jgi:hypothetical protein
MVAWPQFQHSGASPVALVSSEGVMQHDGAEGGEDHGRAAEIWLGWCSPGTGQKALERR